MIIIPSRSGTLKVILSWQRNPHTSALLGSCGCIRSATHARCTIPKCNYFRFLRTCTKEESLPGIHSRRIPIGQKSPCRAAQRRTSQLIRSDKGSIAAAGGRGMRSEGAVCANLPPIGAYLRGERISSRLMYMHRHLDRLLSHLTRLSPHLSWASMFHSLAEA